MAVVRQKGFTSGELAPAMYGRDDLAAYARGLRRCRNFFISKHGAAVSRPGTVEICDAYEQSASRAVRLIPFVFSESQSYLVEVSPTKLRVWGTDGAAREDLSPPWTVGVLLGPSNRFVEQLQYAQVGNAMYLAVRDAPVHVLRRVSDTEWTLTEIDFDLDAFPQYVQLTDVDETGDASHPVRQWQWKVTLVGKKTDGTYFESAPRTVTRVGVVGTFPAGSTDYGGTAAVYPEAGFFAELAIGSIVPSAAFTLGTEYEGISVRIYRGRGSLFGLIGEIDYSLSTQTWMDVGDDPDYLTPPPLGENPFETGTVGVLTGQTQYPGAVTFFEQRLALGGSDAWPAKVWLSATDDWNNFDQPTLATDDKSVEFDVATQQREEIRALLGDRRLLVFTNAGVYAASGAGGGPITPSSVEVRRQGDVGCGYRQPLSVGGAALWTKGGRVRAAAFNDTAGGYASQDLTFVSEHLLKGHEIVDWCYADEPWGVVWAARDDGKLLSLSFDPQQGLTAWALHETDGVVESCCVLPTDAEDVVYLVVRRTDGDGGAVRTIERFDGRRDATVALDCATTVTNASSLLVPTALKNRADIYAVADGSLIGPLTASGLTVQLGDTYDSATVGLRFTADLELLDLNTEDAKKVTSVTWEVTDSRGLETGESLDKLTRWKQRTVADSWDAVGLTTERVEIRIRSTWNKTGRAVLKQADPFPLTVVGVARTVEVGG